MGLIRNILSVLAGRRAVEQSVDGNEQDSSWDRSTSWYTSEEEELEERQQEQVWESLEDVKINTIELRVLFPGGLKLTLPQAIGHMKKLHKDLPTDTVESAMFEWLEMNTAPENVTQEQMDKHDQIIESWIKDCRKTQEKLLDNS